MLPEGGNSNNDEKNSFDKDKFEMLKLVSDLAERESDRTWTRYSLWLYTNIGLIAILSLAFDSEMFLIGIVPAVMGITISIIWIDVNTLSKYYEERWIKDMKALIKSDTTLSKWIRGRNKPRIDKPFEGRGGLFYRNLVPKIFLTLWIFILVVIVFNEIWEIIM